MGFAIPFDGTSIFPLEREKVISLYSLDGSMGCGKILYVISEIKSYLIFILLFWRSRYFALAFFEIFFI